MKALILNSGMGTRMGEMTNLQPKCLAKISQNETILSRQLRQVTEAGLKDVVITTGPFDSELQQYCKGLELPLNYTFVHNPDYKDTNYIYSIFLARKHLNDELIFMHGDLVVADEVMHRVAECGTSCMAVSAGAPRPQKDFKAVIKEGKIAAVGVDLFENAVAAWPLYRLTRDDWEIWRAQIDGFCRAGDIKCYAENALNRVAERCSIYPLNVGDMLCAEVDNQEDLSAVLQKLRETENRTVYMCFSSDVLHGGHMSIIRKAASLGRLTIGVMSDEAVASYKRLPLLPVGERRTLFENIKGVDRVIEQKELSYKNVLMELKPDIVVHGDDWREGFQQPLRQEVLDITEAYGGKVVEFPYSNDPKYTELERRIKAELSLPDNRRGRLKKLLKLKGLVTAMEAHDGLSGLIVENTVVHEGGGSNSFDAMWVSSLCDSTAKGKPDIELVDMTSRFRTIDDLTEVTTKPIIFDGDTGGLTEHFVYTVRTLEKHGVSAVVIEDKTGLKKNSLFGTEAVQYQDSIEAFSRKIAAGKQAQKSDDFMIVARIESLILEKGLDDALQRAFAFAKAGADGIMIHSRKKAPDEVFEFCRLFREKDGDTMLVVAPTSFNTVTEQEWRERGVNIVIYANHLMRSQIPAMRKTAETILTRRRSLEADENLMPFEEIISMIPDEV